jgi:hypothetical protein
MNVSDHDLRTALDELVHAKGVELPSIPSSAGRSAYLRFLGSRGYREDELLPVIQREKVTPEMKAQLFVALFQALKSDDRKFLNAIVWMAYNTLLGRDNTNLTIYGLSQPIAEDFRNAGIVIAPFYAGVFPTDSYNAQCCVFEGQNLVLLDTGLIEMAESLVVSFLSKAPISQKVLDFSTTIDEYVLRGKRADSSDVDSTGVDFGSGFAAAVTTSFEEFIIAHELGHLALGHADGGRLRRLVPKVGESIDVIAKSEFQEYQADIWACRTLIDRARRREHADSNLPLAIAGVALGLGVGLLVEASAQRHGIRLASGHPPASDRLYMVETCFELFGAHEDAFVARRFRELLEEVIRSRYTDAELPPLLSRDLNQKLIPVLDSLRVDYSNAPYISNFV